MKKCPKCSKNKKISEFGKDRTRPTGITSWCKICRNKKARKLRSTDEYREWNRNHKSDKRKNDINYRLAGVLRVRINEAIKNYKKSEATFNLVGCSLSDLKSYLEKKFKDGMSWENYGEWHIDHIKPCASFNLKYKSEQKKCFHYTNLQPLWAEENLSKSDKILSDDISPV